MKKQKTPWPTKAVMEQIYEQHLWGGKTHTFYSGDGSHNTTITQPYLNATISFLKTHNGNLSVLDLGCGDFNIGQHLVEYSKNYKAIDIVKPLIEHHKIKFKKHNLEFLCLDISKDTLPKADCVILRQVLQHLSNSEILRIVNQLKHYKYIILTEHLPNGEFKPNKDIIANQGNRVKYNSGVDLLEAPFYLKVKTETILSEVILGDGKGRILNLLYTLF